MQITKTTSQNQRSNTATRLDLERIWCNVINCVTSSKNLINTISKEADSLLG